MNIKVILAGIVLISITFLGGFYFFFIQRQEELRSLNTIDTPSTGELVTLTNKQEFERAQAIAEKESYSFEFLLRGTVLSYENNQLSVLAKIQNQDGTNQEKIVTVVTPSNDQILCWPETLQAGSTQIPVKNAYFQLEPGQDLMMNSQTENMFSALQPSQIESSYIFAIVTENLRNQTTDQFEAKQMAILGC